MSFFDFACHRICAFAICIVASSVITVPARAFDGWHLESATVIPGKAANFDYISLDATRNRLFLGHRKAGLIVFDLATKTAVKTIDKTDEHSSNGALLLPEFDLGISNNEDGTLTPFSLSTLEAKPVIDMKLGLGKEVDTSYYDPFTKRVVVHMEGDERGTDIHFLEAPSLKVLHTIRLATREAEHGVADGKGNYFLAAREMALIYKIDAAAMKVTAKWETPGCTRPTGLTYNKDDDRLLIGCRGDAANKPAFAVMDARTGSVTVTYEMGAGNDGVAYDPDLKRAFFTNGVAAHLMVFERLASDRYKLVETLGTRPQVKTLAYDAKAKKLYAMTAEVSQDTAKKINTKNGTFYPNTYFPNSFTILIYSK